jgi:hypothetical protein
MKSWVLLGAAVILGLAVGIGTTVFERMSHDEPFLPADFARLEEAREAQSARQLQQVDKLPKVEFVNGRVYEFGSMERFSKRTHTFVVKNAGNAPLTLEVVRTTCKCTISSVNGESFMPGETGEIAVEWTGQTLSQDPEFKQGVELVTNDPTNEHISLVISGYVTESVRAFPPEVVVGRVASKSGGEAEFRLFGFRSEELEVLSTKFENPTTADLFDVRFEPLPAEEIEKEKGATCGVLGRLSVKSGLPLGPIIQTIRIDVRVEKDVTVYMPIKGSTVSDIVVASSSRYESRTTVLNFGALAPGESAKEVLQVFVRGEHRETTKLSLGKVDPADYLKVDIGPAEELNNGRTVRYKVTIEIPAGLDRVNHLGAEYGSYGEVVLNTTHPVTKQVPIRVRFAVD